MSPPVPTARAPLAAPEAGALPQKPRLGSAPPQYGQENLFRAVASSIFTDEKRYVFKNSCNACRVIRHWLPIFLPFSSPFSRVAITSASVTPRARAASVGPSNSGTPPTGGGASGGGVDPITGGTAGEVPCGADIAAIICWPIARPAPSCAAVPAMLPPSPPLVIASAI